MGASGCVKTTLAVFEIVPYTLVPYSLYSVHDIVHYIGNREREFGHYADASFPHTYVFRIRASVNLRKESLVFYVRTLIYLRDRKSVV